MKKVWGQGRDGTGRTSLPCPHTFSPVCHPYIPLIKKN